MRRARAFEHAPRGWMRLACLCVLLAEAAVGAHEAEQREAFKHGLELFDRAKTPEEFLQSATVFESIVSAGGTSGAVSYNLGNAYMRAGRPAQALAAYRRAQQALPRDPYVDANLRAAVAQLPDTPRQERETWWKKILFWHDSLAQTERMSLFAAAWLLTFMAALIRLWAFPSPGRTRKSLGWFTIACAIGGGFLTVSAFLGYREEVQTQHGVVIHETTGRKGNGESYAPVFEKPLKEGSEFEVLEHRGDWLAVRLGASGEAWILARDADLY